MVRDKTARSVWPLLERPTGLAKSEAVYKFKSVYKAANKLAAALAALTAVDLEYMRDKPFSSRRPPDTFLDPVMDISRRAAEAAGRVPADEGGPVPPLPFWILVSELLRIYEGVSGIDAKAPKLIKLVDEVRALAGEARQ